MAPSAWLEERTQELALGLLERARPKEPWLPDAAFFDEVVLDFCMRHPRLRAELFRFVDVLPALSPDDVTRHLVEYWGAAREDLPAPLRWPVDLATQGPRAARAVALLARRNVMRLGRRFIAGSDVSAVMATVRALRQRRMAVTLDALGEAVLTDREADVYRDAYIAVIRSGARTLAELPEDPLIDRDFDGSELPRVSVSVKLSALTPVFDPIDPEGTLASVAPRLEAILDAARSALAFVHVDMEQFEKKDLTLDIFERIVGSGPHRHTPHVGIVLQAYLRDVEHDIARVSDWARKRGTPVWVRLVKGAYWDSETVLARQRGWTVPVWDGKGKTDASFERAAARLLSEARFLRAAFASHNARSVGHALALVEERRLPPGFVEFQALYGMADGLKTALVEHGQRVRVYAPFGQIVPGMAYLVRRLLENTSNESFVRNEQVHGEAALELVQPPSDGDPEFPASPEESPMSTRVAETFANEPLADFADGDVRARFAAALTRVSGELGIRCPLVIDGSEHDTPEQIESRSPEDTRRLVAESSSATEADVDRAVAAAARGFREWRATPVETRAETLVRVAELFAARRDELAAWTSFEAGKPWRDADADIAEAIDFCRYYATAARSLFSLEPSSVPGEDNVTLHAPRGPTAIISPWNFPMAILTGMTAAALVTGNPVLMKPAEQTPACGWHVFRAFREAGVPASAIHFLPGVGEVAGARLVSHPDIATIAFTGSRAVGHFIARTAAATSTGRYGIKRVIAEMGGKNAIIVDEDADLDEAIPGVLASAFGYAGQKCSACSRVVVVSRIYEPFLERLAGAARAMVVGPASEARSTVGPLIDSDAVERLRRYAESAARDGRVVFRAELGPGTEHGLFFPPMIVADVAPGSPLAQEEVFGPILAVSSAPDLDAALRIANGTDYALTGGLYSRSPAHIARAREELDVGNLYINRKITGAEVWRQPFGGHRHSGTGAKTGGRDYLKSFADARTVSENTMRRGFTE